MEKQIAGPSKRSSRECNRKQKNLNPYQINEILLDLNFLDDSDLELSDDDDVVDATYLPDMPNDDELEENETEDEIIQEEAEEEIISIAKKGKDTWIIDDSFRSDSCIAEIELQFDESEVRSPIEYFERYITSPLFTKLAIHTSQQILKKGKSSSITDEEMKRFIGLNMFMSVMKLPWIRLYWHNSYGIPVVKSTMTRDRFFLIRSHLKVIDDAAISLQQRKDDKLWKVKPIIDCVLQRCLALKRPSEVCIDEQMIPFTGRSELKQYVPNKPNPEGLKNWVLASPSGLVLDFEVAQGKQHL